MRHIFTLALALALSGCATQRFELQANSPSAPALDDAQTFWIGGIGQNQEVDSAKVCGSAAQVRLVETQLTPGNVGLTLLTLGIYSPRQIRIYCTR